MSSAANEISFQEVQPEQHPERTGFSLQDFHLTFPTKENPHPVAVNPHAGETIGAIREMATDLGVFNEAEPGFLNKFQAFATLAGYFYPRANQETAVSCGMFVDWLFVVDDSIDDSAEQNNAHLTRTEKRLKKFLDIVKNGGRLPADAPATDRFTLEIHDRLKKELGGEQYQEFAQLVEAYLLGSLQDTKNTVTQRVPTEEEFERERIPAGASWPCIYLLRLAEGISVPLDATTRRMGDLCALIMSYLNDFVSYPKEASTSSPNNLIRVLQVRRKISLAEAYQEAMKIINRLADEFDTLDASIADSEQKKWAVGMRQMIDANNYWSIKSKRYVHPDSPIRELRPND